MSMFSHQEKIEQPSRVIVNSLPKSGTHLLAKVVELCGYQEHFKQTDNSSIPLFLNYREVKDALQNINIQTKKDDIAIGTLTPVNVPADILAKWLGAIPQQNYLMGHVAWNQAFSQLLTQYNCIHLMIIRDPRAIIASLLSFILDASGMPKRHFLEADFREYSTTKQLDMLLEGGYAPIAGVEIKPFYEIFQSFYAWSQDASCLLVKFEDLIGEQGGGHLTHQSATVKKIIEHLKIASDTTLEQILTQVYDKNARTFRIGKINSWQQVFEKTYIDRIEAYCQPLCQMAGYL